MIDNPPPLTLVLTIYPLHIHRRYNSPPPPKIDTKTALAKDHIKFFENRKKNLFIKNCGVTIITSDVIRHNFQVSLNFKVIDKYSIIIVIITNSIRIQTSVHTWNDSFIHLVLLYVLYQWDYGMH